MTGVLQGARRVTTLTVSRFGLVGLTCATFQYFLNTIFLQMPLPPTGSFALSFVVSSQLNFVLSSHFTWRSRRHHMVANGQSLKAWVAYNASSLVALGLSSAAFVMLLPKVGNSLAVGGGIAAGACLTFFVGDRLIFASRPASGVTQVSLDLPSELTERAQTTPWDRPGSEGRHTAMAHQTSPLDTIPRHRLLEMLGRGVAIFLPCYNESENIPLVVQRTLNVLESIAAPYQVILVDDGSTDDTGAVARQLATLYPQTVTVVTHDQNLGYGNALRSGFAAGIAGGWDWIGFIDSDNQFDPREVEDLLAAAYYQHVDLVAGFRIRRADGVGRLVIGRMWHLLTRLVVGIRERDVDCGFKLVHRNVLQSIDLHGRYAAVSPELLARSRRAGYTCAEVGVHHYPRLSGEQTGANLVVILRSLAFLFRLRRSLTRGSRPAVSGGATAAQALSAVGVTFAASALALASFLYFYLRGDVLAYDDSISHLLIARRLLDGSTPGVAQLGSVWLPLPHLLLQPLIWDDSLFYSGIAGAAISMISFVVATVFLFKTGAVLTGSRLGGWVAGLIFALNPNILYLQSTPMTETLLFACMAVAVYELVLWSHSERWQHLSGAAAAILLATLTRYEGWVLLISFAVMVLYITIRRSYRRSQSVANWLFFLVFAAAGVVGWLVWNRAIFGSFTDFESGQFSKPSLWVGNSDIAVGNLKVSSQTYLLAVTGTVGLPVVALGVGGLIRYLWFGRLRAQYCAPLTLLVFLPFFIVALFSGQRPLHVQAITGDLYNTRFGLVMLLPIALFAAVFVDGLLRRIVMATSRRRHTAGAQQLTGRRALTVVTIGILGVVVSGTFLSGGVLTLKEPLQWARGRTELTTVAAALRVDYDNGRVLMEGFGNEYVAFTSEVPSDEIIYEGSYHLWQSALTHPAQQQIKWIYLSRNTTDMVWRALGRSGQLANYRIRFDDGTRVIYELR